MSLLPAEVNAELAQLLQALQSADNNVRSQAEEHLQNNWTAPRPEVLLMGLVEQIAGSPDTAVGPLPSSSPTPVKCLNPCVYASSTYRDLSFVPDAVLCCPYLSPNFLQDKKDCQLRDDGYVHLPEC